MPINVIVNGTFDAGSANWTGVDIEFNPERAYLPGGSTNLVSEIDGGRNQTTILEQTFTIDRAVTTELTFDVALRTAALNDAPNDGFDVEIVDSTGTVIATLAVRPDANVFVGQSLPVTFPAAGDYTLRFIEVGDDDSLGAIVDNIEIMVCFGAGTQIMTPSGDVPVETLRVGDVVSTMDGPKTLRWIGRRHVNAGEMAAHAGFAPIRITAGALGCGLPSKDLLVSRQHRMLAQSPVVARMFGADNILVSAIRLTELPGIFIDTDLSEVTYFHLLFDNHEVVFANSAPSESMLTGPEALKALTAEARAEIAQFFPDIPVPVCPVPSPKRQRQFVDRLSRNNRPVLQSRQGFQLPLS